MRPALEHVCGKQTPSAGNFYFCKRICRMFEVFKCTGHCHLGLCTFWVLARRELLCNVKFRFSQGSFYGFRTVKSLLTPSTQCYLFPILMCFSMLMLILTKSPPLHGGGLTFSYTSHDMNRFIPHVHHARPLNGFENGPNLAEDRIEYLLLTS